MKSPLILAALGATLGMCVMAGAAHARNPHCAGGIQYVVQGMRDKEKGNISDYQREMAKAVDQLQTCSSEDPADFEALSYLGWAYAEVDSAGPAGAAFQKSIDGLNAKGDKKKAEWASNNRDSYWATAFNNGITKINEAQAAYPDYQKAAETDADKTLKTEAGKKYQTAIHSLTNASMLKPGDPRTLRNLGSCYAFMGDYSKAEGYFAEGLKAAPGDSELMKSMASVRSTAAGSLIDQKKYDEAITYYSGLLKTDPNNGDLQLGLAEAYFKRAQSGQGDSRKPDFKLAGDAYAKAGSLKAGNADLPFNAALAYQNAGEPALAEGQWRAALKVRPDDLDAMSALGATLADQKKFDEAVAVLMQAVDKDPKNKVFHRQLGAVYTKAGNNPKATEELMVYLALQNGQPAADAAAEAKKLPGGSAAGKMLASMGTPDQVNPWEADGQKYQTWFYWGKKNAFHYNPEGAQVGKSDWSSSTATAGKGK